MADPQGNRIAELERRVRNDRLLLMTVTVVALAVFLMGLSGAGKSIDSGAFVVRDSQNRKRAVLQVDSNGFPSLSLYDEAGKVRADLALILNSPQLNLYKPDGKTSLEADVGPDGNPGIWLVDDKGKERAVLELRGENATPVLKLSDPQSVPRLLFAVLGPSGQPVIQVVEADGKSVFLYPFPPTSHGTER